MFAKSLLIACSTATVSAVKLTAQVSLSSLAGVNIAALSQSELNSLLLATEEVFEQLKQESGVQFLTAEEDKARHLQMMSTEAILQEEMKKDSSYEHSPNLFSLKTAAEKQAYNGTKPFEPNQSVDPVHEPKNGLDMDTIVQEFQEKLLAQDALLALSDTSIALQDDAFWNTVFPGCTNTYQYIYNQGTAWGCQSFEAWDDQWLEQVAYRTYYEYYVESGYCSDEYLRQWWNQNVLTWRETLRAHLQCAVEPDNDDNENNDNNGDDSNNNTDNCRDINGSQCIWGSEYVTPIKNQGSCGSCYAFSATQILESYAAIRGDGLYEISEQQIVDCGYGNNGGCNGGWPASVLRDTNNADTAIMPTNDYEYMASKNSCQVNSKTPSFRIQTDGSSSVKSVQSKNLASFKQALMNGPLAVTVDANDKFMGYSSGVLRNCVYGQLNHAVNAVGWTQINGVEVLKIRNSWGAYWGDEGYVYIAIDEAGAAENGGLGPCGILEYGYYSAAKKI